MEHGFVLPLILLQERVRAPVRVWVWYIGMYTCKSPRSHLFLMLLLIEGRGEKGVIAPLGALGGALGLGTWGAGVQPCSVM